MQRQWWLERMMKRRCQKITTTSTVNADQAVHGAGILTAIGCSLGSALLIVVMWCVYGYLLWNWNRNPGFFILKWVHFMMQYVLVWDEKWTCKGNIGSRTNFILTTSRCTTLLLINEWKTTNEVRSKKDGLRFLNVATELEEGLITTFVATVITFLSGCILEHCK